MKKKVLICGASGFIGRNIAEFFCKKSDYEIYGTYFNSAPIDNIGITMIKVDLTKEEDVSRVLDGMDIIIQAAAATSGAKDIVNKPYYHVTDNAVMNSIIFRSAYEHSAAHVIFFSCTVMYQSGELPVKETDFDANKPMYSKYFGVGWTKVYIEKMCEFYANISDTKYTVIRHSNIYGPYDKFDLERSHVFGATVTKVMEADEGSSIIVWGSGEEERDLLYVSDLSNAVELVIKKQDSAFELFNIGYGMSISVKELVKKIINFSGKRVKIEYDLAKPTIRTKLCLNTDKAAQQLGWSAKISLNEGIQKTIDWYKLNLKMSDYQI